MIFLRLPVAALLLLILSACTHSVSDECLPYFCADGTEVKSCSEDGHVINYFADPCMNHGLSELQTGSGTAKGSVDGLQFDYPAYWGTFGVDPSQSGRLPEKFMVFSKISEGATYPNNTPEIFDIMVRPYDSGSNRSYSYTGYEDEQIVIDVVKQKADTEAAATMTIAGYPATFEEFYDAEGAVIAREYLFFTPKDRIEILTGYNVTSLYSDEYYRRSNDKHPPSISELVAEDTDRDFSEPYENVLAAFPEKARGMETFFSQADAVIRSMHTAQ